MKLIFKLAVAGTITLASLLIGSAAHAENSASVVFENRSLYVTHGGCRPSNQDSRVEIWLHLNDAPSDYDPRKDLSAAIYLPLEEGRRVCAELFSAYVQVSRVKFRLGYDLSQVYVSNLWAVKASLLEEPAILPGLQCRLYGNFSWERLSVDSSYFGKRIAVGENFVIGQGSALDDARCGSCGRQSNDLIAGSRQRLSLEYPREVTFKVGGFNQTGGPLEREWSFRILDSNKNVRMTFRSSLAQGRWFMSLTNSAQTLTTDESEISFADVSNLLPLLRANERCPMTISVDPSDLRNLRARSECNPYSSLILRPRFG